MAITRGTSEAGRPPRILLRSSWQTVNIGDIAHTPGVLRLLEKHLPDAQIRLWPSSVGNGVGEMLQRRFPRLTILKGPEDISTAIKECDFMLHSSGPYLVGEDSIARWRTETGKPYGIYGITLSGASPETASLISGARFALFRDSVSLQAAKDKGITCPVMEFGPDGAFATDLSDDASATAFLRSNGLEDGRFLCVIPRFRYTPYWKIYNKPMTPEDDRKHARNEAMKEHDNAPLREAIIAVVRQTSLKVLICPEDESQVAIGKEMLYDPLPDDVKAKVVWRDRYWLTNEALSTYRRSAGLFGLEMHSPILCIGSGIPAIVCRFSEQTSKGFMWRDIGLQEWLFDMDSKPDVARLVPTVLALAKNPGAARRKAEQAKVFVEKRQKETMQLLKKALA